jgi:hypothetical protein
LAPATHLLLTPGAVVEVNPQPLPPMALVLFTPEPGLVPPGPPIIPSGPVGAWLLDAVYVLDGQVTETAVPPVPPNSPASGTVTDSYALTGHLVEVLVPPGPQQSPAWVCDASVSDHGEVSVSFEEGDPTAPMGMIHESFRDSTATAQVCRDTAGGPMWKFDTTVVTRGALGGAATDKDRPHITGTRIWSEVSLDRGITGTLQPLDQRGNPGPWQLSATETVVTKDPDMPADNTLTAVRAGPVVVHFGRFDLVDTLEATVTPPPTPAGPAPPVTVAQQAELMGDFQGIWIDIGS